MIPGLPIKPRKVKPSILCACGCGMWFRRKRALSPWLRRMGYGIYRNHACARRGRYATAAVEVGR